MIWKHPPEGSLFISDDASADDVIQGAIGDCWFIGALSVLATRDELLRGGFSSDQIKKDMKISKELARDMSRGVFPPMFHVYMKQNIWVFKFFKNFAWRYVIIDNKLPCYISNGTPVFGRCKDIKELWVPLIEKAYAKLHGCYETLISGFIDDGLTDMTGFVAEKLNMHDKKGRFPNKMLPNKEDFFEYIFERDREGCMMGCAKKGQPNDKRVEVALSNGII
jgi:calpain